LLLKQVIESGVDNFGQSGYKISQNLRFKSEVLA